MIKTKTTTTTKDFNEFKKWFLFYVKALGLTEFEFSFFHEYLTDEDEIIGGYASEAAALVRINTCNKLASVYLNKDAKDDVVNSDTLKRAALHEVIHILLSDYWHYAKSRFDVSEELLGIVEHTVVRRLENFVLG